MAVWKEGYIVKVRNTVTGTVIYDTPRTESIYVSERQAVKEMENRIRRGWEAELLKARVIVDDPEEE